MDLADAAYTTETQARDAALAAARMALDGNGLGPEWRNGKAYCRECGDLIPAKRLLAMPGTSMCVDCAAQAQGE